MAKRTKAIVWIGLNGTEYFPPHGQLLFANSELMVGMGALQQTVSGDLRQTKVVEFNSENQSHRTYTVGAETTIGTIRNDWGDDSVGAPGLPDDRKAWVWEQDGGHAILTMVIAEVF